MEESDSEEGTSPIPVSSKRRQRIESDVSLTNHTALQSCSAHNPRQLSTSSISSQELSDYNALDDDVYSERAGNQRLQRVRLASDSSSESGEGRIRKTGTRRVKRLGVRQRSRLSIKPNQYHQSSRHSSEALMFDAPTVDMCSLDEIAVSESCSSHGLDTSYSTLPKQPQRSRNKRNQPSTSHSAQNKFSRQQDVDQSFVSKRKKANSGAANDSFRNYQKDMSESNVASQHLTAVTSPLLSPKTGLKNKPVGEKTSTFGQHNLTLASWEKIASLGVKSTKGPMLFAHEHLQARLQVQEDWMTKARYIWSQWKKLSREARSVYTETAKRNRMERSPRNRYAGHKFDSGSSQDYTSVHSFIPFRSTSRPVQVTSSSMTASTVLSTHQPSSLLVPQPSSLLTNTSQPSLPLTSIPQFSSLLTNTPQASSLLANTVSQPSSLITNTVPQSSSLITNTAPQPSSLLANTAPQPSLMPTNNPQPSSLLSNTAPQLFLPFASTVPRPSLLPTNNPQPSSLLVNTSSLLANTPQPSLLFTNTSQPSSLLANTVPQPSLPLTNTPQPSLPLANTVSQSSSLLNTTVPPVTQRVTQLASQYFQEHSLPGGMSFRQPSFTNGSMFSPTKMSCASEGSNNTSLSGAASTSDSLYCPTVSKSVGLPGDYHDRSLSGLASPEQDKSMKAILSSTNLKPVYHSTVEAPRVLSDASNDEPVSRQSVTPTFSPLALPLFVAPVEGMKIASLVSPSSSLPASVQRPLSQPILYQTTSKQQYSIAGMQSGSDGIVSHLGLQNRPQPSASIGSNIQTGANSYSIATMNVHRSSATVHHKPTSISSSASSSTTIQQAFKPAKTISSPVDNSSSSITNPSSTSSSFSPTIPSILASSSKPSTSVGLTEVSDEWRRILLERVKELGIKKQAKANKNKPVKKKQRRRSDSLSLTSMNTAAVYSPFAQSPKVSPATAFPFFPEVSQAATFPLTTVQSDIMPSSSLSSKAAVSMNEHKCLVADEPSELHNIFPVSQNLTKTMAAPPVATTTVLNSMVKRESISGSPHTTNSSPLSPSTPNVTSFSPNFNTSPANLSSAYYADLERHYWQCLLQLEHHKQYTEMVHQHLKEALHHQQIMLLQSDKYQEFLQKLVPPDSEPPRELNRLNHSTAGVPKHEFEGTFDKPIMKIIS